MKRLLSWLLALVMIISCLPMSVLPAFAAEEAPEVETGTTDPDFSLTMWDLMDGGSEESPLDLTNDLLYENDFSATVTIPANEVGYFIAYRVAGMNMTINDGEAVACTGDNWTPYSWTITNDTDAAVEYTIKVAFPEGHQQNPVVTDELGGTISIPEGNQYYYYYNYTAAETGTITVYISSITEGVEADIILNNLNTYEQKTLQNDGVDNYGLEVSMDVNAGDVVNIQIVTLPDENYVYPAADITWVGNFTYPVGSEQNPVTIYSNMLDANGNYTVTIPAGETWNICAYYVGGMSMTINGGEAVIINGFSYPFTITNDGEADAEYVINFTYPLGHQQNPETIDIDYTSDIALAENDSDGYYYKYIAEEDGTINFNINTITEGVTGDIVVTNQTSGAYVSLTSEGVDGVLAVEVTTGDELIIQVVTNWDENYVYPAATINWTGAYEAAEVVGTIDTVGKALNVDGVIYINYYAKFNSFGDEIDQTYIQENGGLLVWDSAVAAEDVSIDYGTPDINEGLKFVNESRGYLGVTDGIPMAEYANELYFCMYLKMPSGNYVYSEVIEYSVQMYCENQLSKPTASTELKNMCASMLHFGAAAQEKFSVNTSDLANANIITTWPAEEFDDTLLTSVDSFTSSIEASSSVTTIGKTLVFEGAIYINYYFRPSFTPASCTMLYWTGINEDLSESNCTSLGELNYTSAQGGSYLGSSSNIPAAEYEKTIFACAKFVDENGDVHYSDIIAYSPELYVANQLAKTSITEVNRNLYERMVIYGEYAKEYFN